MTERTAHDAGVTACPFVAFVDDRDERADVPDHRHRCYAEIRPAQRALAHQEAFCLSAGFAPLTPSGTTSRDPTNPRPPSRRSWPARS